MEPYHKNLLPEGNCSQNEALSNNIIRDDPIQTVKVQRRYSLEQNLNVNHQKRGGTRSNCKSQN